MASKNLGAVIQRAISDGAFRRQLQSDPAAALRGFNLTPDEVAAIRSADSSKLMSLGVDQRMSKAFSVSGMLGATRATTSDLGAGGNSLVADATVGTHEGMADPTISGTRAIHDDAPADLRTATTIGDLSGVRSIHDVAPFGTPGTSAVEDPNSPEFGAAQSTGDLSSVRAVNDVAPFGTPGTSAVEDPNAPEFGAARTTGDLSAPRPVHDSEPFAGNAAINDNLAAASAGRGSSLAGDMPDTRAVNDSEPFAGNAAISDNLAAADAGRGGSLAGEMSGTGSSAAEDPYSGSFQGVSPDFQANDGGTLASRMADAGSADAARAIHDVAPFEGDASAVTPTGPEFAGGDTHFEPGPDSSHTSESLGSTGPDSGDEHSWG
jgi:hypothetical protein